MQTKVDSLGRQQQQIFNPGDIIAGSYEFVEWLGQGGMGKVCRCKAKKENGRNVALKMVPEILKGNPEAEKLLNDEFYKMLDLTRDTIVPIRCLVEDEFRFYIVMDYAEGETLDAYLKNHPKPGLEITKTVVAQLADALDYAHKKGLVHCDMKPANVMVDIDGSTVKSVKLLDFGLGLKIRESVSHLRGVMSSGTPSYKAPEQWRPDLYDWKLTAKADVYSLGAVAYEMLEGGYPFSKFDLATFPNAVLNVPPPPVSGLPPYVNAALQKALAKKPEERFDSCMAFANALSTPSSVQPAPSVVKTPSAPAIEKKDMTIMLPGDVPLELVHIRAGSFWMGSPAEELERYGDETLHRVMLTKDFWLGRYEVTQGQWMVVMGSNPSVFQNGDRYPVEQVSWEEAMDFCRKVTEMERSAGRLPAGYEYMLPTEAHWEYACRAGTTTPYSFGSALNGDKANCDGNYPYGGIGKGRYLQRTSEVGSYAPNAWGLYDMHGNVWEWCRDWFGDYPSGSATDPTGPSSGSGRVLRGGSWSFSAGCCRSAYRDCSDPADRYYNIGFRVALAAVQ